MLMLCVLTPVDLSSALATLVSQEVEYFVKVSWYIVMVYYDLFISSQISMNVLLVLATSMLHALTHMALILALVMLDIVEMDCHAKVNLM